MTARLAVVDDDKSFADFARTLLTTRGYEVDVFNSGADFLESLRAGSQPNIVLLDVMMPDVDGLETLRSIRSLNQSVQVIMLSGRQAPATIVEAVRLGAADYVLKPGDAEGLGEAALEAAIRNALERQTLSAEVARLGAQMVEDPEGAQPCWASNGSMQSVLNMVDRVADSDVTVLLSGESGVGKEVIARELHRRSSRRTKPFLKVNCAAMPGELLESELFGHERGAFTGASGTRIGKFEFAQQGTILLDEITEMPLPLQAKLLHVLQDRQLTRLGGNRTIEVDARVLAATNRVLEDMIRTGAFREDLYYRLQVIEIRIPALRERQEEIGPLVEFFLAKFAGLYRRPRLRASQALMRALTNYHWPGNIRELENMLKRYVVLQDETSVLTELERLTASPRPRAADRPVIAPPVAASAPASNGHAAAPPVESLDAAAKLNGNGESAGLHALIKEASVRAERQAIDEALVRFRWNRRKAAAYLKVSYKTLLNKMKECGISDPNAA